MAWPHQLQASMASKLGMLLRSQNEHLLGGYHSGTGTSSHPTQGFIIPLSILQHLEQFHAERQGPTLSSTIEKHNINLIESRSNDERWSDIKQLQTENSSIRFSLIQ